jgi:hypothetical protein
MSRNLYHSPWGDGLKDLIGWDRYEEGEKGTQKFGWWIRGKDNLGEWRVKERMLYVDLRRMHFLWKATYYTPLFKMPPNYFPWNIRNSWYGSSSRPPYPYLSEIIIGLPVFVFCKVSFKINTFYNYRHYLLMRIFLFSLNLKTPRVCKMMRHSLACKSSLRECF